MATYTPKQRMLNAYRGIASDRAPIAPEFWYYYPAKVMGKDMIQFQREVPFHLALKATFEKFECEGWGATFAGIPNPDVETRSEEKWLNADQVHIRQTTRTPLGELTSASLLDRREPGWATERPIKDFERDLPIYEYLTLGVDPEKLDSSSMVKAWQEVGESYLLEAWVGVPFFDYYGGAREGSMEATIIDFQEHESELRALQERYIDHMVRRSAVICQKTPIESLCIGCSWSCNSLEGPTMWRIWDKPMIKAVADEVHRHGRMLHVHLHGRCMETVADLAEIGIDCVCPFERPPGGDVEGLAGLRQVARLLDNKVTMNGNVHTVETLIRGTEEDTRREVREIWEAFHHTPRVIVGTGDQVGGETPEANLHAMIDEARRLWAG